MYVYLNHFAIYLYITNVILSINYISIKQTNADEVWWKGD